jgi:hypothetical protein
MSNVQWKTLAVLIILAHLKDCALPTKTGSNWC